MASADDELDRILKRASSPAEPALLDQSIPKAPDADSELDRILKGKTSKPAAPTVDTWDDVKKAVPSGLAKGVANLVGLPGNLREMVRMGGDWLQRKIGLEQAPQLEDVSRLGSVVDIRQPTGADIQKKMTGTFGDFYEPQTTTGKYVGKIAEYAPGVLIGGGGTGIVQRTVGNVVAPAVGEEAAGQWAQKNAPSWEGVARVGGSLGGAMTIPAARSVITPMPARPTYQRHVDLLDQEGIPLSAGERTGNQAMRYIEDATKTIPMGGRRIEGQAMDRDIAFTRAALRRAGINAAEATPETLGPAYTAMGNEFRRFENNFPIYGGSPNGARLQQDVQNVLQRYATATSPSTRVQGVQQSADDIIAATTPQGPGHLAPLSGDRLSNLRNALRERAEGQDFQTQRAFNELRTAVHDALERAMAQANAAGDIQRWRQLRQEYNNFLAIEQAATRGNAKAAEGLIEPAALENAVKAVGGIRNHALGRGNLDELGRLGRAGRVAFTPLPNSGTAQRGAALMGINAAAGAGGAAFGHMMGGAPGAALGAIGGYVAPTLGSAAISRFITHPAIQRVLANQLWVNSPVNATRSAVVAAPQEAIPYALGERKDGGSVKGYADGGMVAPMATPAEDYATTSIERATRTASTHWQNQTRDKNGRWV